MQIVNRIFVKGKLPWLIWAIYNSFPKISENKMKNRSKNTRLRKTLRGRMFYILFCIVFSDFSGNGKHAAARNFTRPRYLFDKDKFNCFEVNYRKKTEAIIRDKLYLTRPHIYLLFFQLNIWSVKRKKTYSIVIQRYKSNLYVSKSNQVTLVREGTKVQNPLPYHIKALQTLEIFKRVMKFWN